MLAETLNQILKEKELLPEELLGRLSRNGCKIHQATLNRWLSGDGSPKCENLPDIADALGVTIDDLFGRSTVSA